MARFSISGILCLAIKKYELNEQPHVYLPLAQYHCQLYKADLPWKASCSNGREHT